MHIVAKYLDDHSIVGYDCFDTVVGRRVRSFFDVGCRCERHRDGTPGLLVHDNIGIRHVILLSREFRLTSVWATRAAR